MLDREKIVTAFSQALNELGEASASDGIRPRAVAIRAHALYSEALGPGRKKPALVTFRKFVAGKSALPEILAMLRDANISPASRTRLDRERLRTVFEEAVQRLETRILKGWARPLHIAQRAYELYTRDAAEGASKPSRHTFERLIYGKKADPEIMTLIQTAQKGKM